MSTVWKLKKAEDRQLSVTGDFWYDIKNGHLKPEGVIGNNQQAKKLYEAIEMLESFERALEELGLLE